MYLVASVCLSVCQPVCALLFEITSSLEQRMNVTSPMNLSVSVIRCISDNSADVVDRLLINGIFPAMREEADGPMDGQTLPSALSPCFAKLRGP